MRIIYLFLSVSLLLSKAATLPAQEYYIKLVENNKEKINSVITSTVSIDKVGNGFVYAYANKQELEKIKMAGYNPEILPHPSAQAKVLNMANTLEEMANWDRYPTYPVYREMMKKFQSDFPELCKLDSIGTTVQGRKLYVVKISDNVTDDELEPELFYTSTMHGDETTGYVLMLRLIDYFLSNYETDERVQNLVNNAAIFINPNANPDGTYAYGNSTVNGSKRYNANGYDINRNFPDPREGSNPTGPHQPETTAMIDYASSRHFVLSANFHGGIELANFPWDTWTSYQNKHADHNWFNTISRQYATLAQENSPSGYFTGENNGVTHGGDWYVVAGGRQDYMNYWHNCREVTFEISDTKLLSTDLLDAYWNYNKESLLTYLELIFKGFQGTVTNSNGEPLDAVITVEEHDKDNSFVVTNPLHGNYYRMIEPGTWQVTYSADGYVDQTHSITIDDYESVVTKDIVLYTSTGISQNQLKEPEVKTFPNPFNEQLTITVSVAEPTTLDIEVYNLAGQKVVTLASCFRVESQHSFSWDVAKKSFSSGVYLIRVTTNEATLTKKVSLL
ncbi:MAG TPA: M14 family zinc carboxypeptidase [Tenuifilaceae bacterium]|nr:M14 family zinc carboxypeptidase [Tenuifilaceae bacterium]HPJ45329.1 M14 family zinc carboxypeptidase [Tenuifilaceae bacterium]HPQ33570.1 M14 family zinc carboxypeptidase [Tenuifilaceae bacterium]HRX67416.1 M14 family zinc carboxypeptidase [Tenuifilaceae bacterium]